MNASKASLKDIQDISGDIERAAHYFGITIEAAALNIESEMDGSQPNDLIPQAIDLANARRANS